MSKRNLIIGLGVVVLAIAWGVFRPELLIINRNVSEQFPGAGQAAGAARILSKGNFKSLAHETKGRASIYEVATGKRVLRLSEFQTSNGPDVHVYLVASEVENGNDTIKRAGFVDLGSMKGNQGDQNYDVPADVDLSKYKAVTIWCARFGVNFGTANLSSQAS